MELEICDVVMSNRAEKGSFLDISLEWRITRLRNLANE